MTATTRAANSNSFKRALLLAGLFVFLLTAPTVFAQPVSIQLSQVGTYASGIFAQGGAEIIAYDSGSKRLFVVNAQAATVDVLDIANPANPTLIFTIDVTPFGAVANSVIAEKGIVAIAVENVDKQADGKVVFFDKDGTYLNDVSVGALPDMLALTPDRRYVLVANEGEPSDDYTVDPEGTISIIDVSKGISKLTQADVRTADFKAFNSAALDPSIRIFGPGASVAQDIEPEFITISQNSKTAYVVLQENNAFAIVDIQKAKVEKLVGMGFKDHMASGNGFDASNRDNAINISNWPTKGMYMPDAVASYQVFGKTLLVTANEGDSRDYDGFSEEERVKDLVLDPAAFPDAAMLQQDANLGRLKTTTAFGDTDGDGDFDEIYSYGARSFSIWREDGRLIFDSGDALEQITAAAFPDDFNSDDEENGSFDDRSDDKGPEPEGVVIGKILSRSYAFIGLERIGGIVVYDITNPYHPTFVQYINNRDFSGDPALGTAGDLSPEGLLFIPRNESPTRRPLLVVGNEVSGTTTLYEINLALPKNSEPSLAENEAAGLPKAIELHQNYPNPFNPSTTIRFSLPQDAKVKIRVVDLMGRTMTILAESRYTAGEHSLLFQATDLASGSYFYSLEIDGIVRQIRKLTLVK